MKSKSLKLLNESFNQHEKVLKNWQPKAKDADLKFLMLSKSFEILVESAWRYLKFKVEDEGLDAPSPKEAIRKAATIGLIDDPQFWMDCINARNDSVHNYFGISEGKFLELTFQLQDACKKLIKSCEG
jgi:uncharacterized protein YutE (UPF0331/DUF86 family)